MTDTTRDKIKDILENGPQVTVSEIARMVGVTRQRADQIVKALGKEFGLRPAKYFNLVPRDPPPRPRSPLFSTAEPVQLPPRVVGTIGELIAAADLMTRGWDVFFPLVHTPRCDLLIISKDGRRVKRIEVKSARKQGNSTVFMKRDFAAHDHYALLLPGEPVVYDPPIENGD